MPIIIGTNSPELIKAFEREKAKRAKERKQNDKSKRLITHKGIDESRGKDLVWIRRNHNGR